MGTLRKLKNKRVNCFGKNQDIDPGICRQCEHIDECMAKIFKDQLEGFWKDAKKEAEITADKMIEEYLKNKKETT